VRLKTSTLTTPSALHTTTTAAFTGTKRLLRTTIERRGHLRSSTEPHIFWTILIFMAWVVWIWIAITVLIDIFRRRDLSGWAKAAWVIFVIVVPFLGVLVYLLVYHDGMAERSGKEAAASQAQFDDYVRTTAATGGSASEIEKAKKLLDSGVITQAEFDAIKAKAIG
jgi:uncharacterized membrane protein YhaH (DUF805 family)